MQLLVNLPPATNAVNVWRPLGIIPANATLVSMALCVKMVSLLTFSFYCD